MRHVCAVMIAMPVGGDVMRRVFVHWSHVLARFMSGAISGCGVSRVVLSQTFVVGRRVRLVGFTTRARFEKSLASPERHRHESRHVKRSTRRCDRADQPDEPAERDMRGRGSVPEYFVFGPETAERNDAADRKPASHEGQYV